MNRHSIVGISKGIGELLFSRAKNAPKPKQVFAEEHIADLNYMLNRVVEAGTGRRSLLGFTPQAGKTGTTQAYRDAWFVGFTANFVTGVWFGNDNYSEMNRVTGGSLPAMTWKNFMLEAEKTKVAKGLPGVPLNGKYTKFAARSDGNLTIPSIPKPDAIFRRSNNSLGNDDVVLFQPGRSKNRRRNGPIVSVLQDMFGIFGNKRPRAKTRRTRNNIFTRRNKPVSKRRRAVQRNARRLRDLLESR